MARRPFVLPCGWWLWPGLVRWSFLSSVAVPCPSELTRPATAFFAPCCNPGAASAPPTRPVITTAALPANCHAAPSSPSTDAETDTGDDDRSRLRLRLFNSPLAPQTDRLPPSETDPTTDRRTDGLSADRPAAKRKPKP